MAALALSTASAQSSNAGARAAALTGSPAAYGSDPWAESNPAGWSGLATHSLVIHAAQLYGLEELRLGSAQMVARLGGWSAALGARTFGYEAYRETAFTAGFARGIRADTHRPFHLGMRVRYHMISIPTYGTASAVGLSTGLIFPILPGLHLGLGAENVAVSQSVISEDLPRRIYAGLAFAGMEMLQVYADVAKDVRSHLVTRISFEARPLRILSLRSGFSLQPARFACGIGFDLTWLAIDFAMERHLVLGWSPSGSAHLRW